MCVNAGFIQLERSYSCAFCHRVDFACRPQPEDSQIDVSDSSTPMGGAVSRVDGDRLIEGFDALVQCLSSARQEMRALQVGFIRFRVYRPDTSEILPLNSGQLGPDLTG